jgi:hypothetical protein
MLTEKRLEVRRIMKVYLRFIWLSLPLMAAFVISSIGAHAADGLAQTAGVSDWVAIIASQGVAVLLVLWWILPVKGGYAQQLASQDKERSDNRALVDRQRAENLALMKQLHDEQRADTARLFDKLDQLVVGYETLPCRDERGK